MRRTFVHTLVAALVLVTSLPAFSASAGLRLSDDFDENEIDARIWSLMRLPDRRHWTDRSQFRQGTGALAIRIKGSDMDDECQCQRNEIREAPGVRIEFGEEAWYSFSFRVEGQGALAGSSRWLIAGWKQEVEGSPFLAQRFDNGVFHLTLESGPVRVLLASAQGEVEGFLDLLKTGILSRFSFVSDPQLYGEPHDLVIEYGENPVLPDPRQGWVDMLYRIKGGLKNDGVVEVYANGRFIARARGTIGLPGATDPGQYLKFGHNRAPMAGTATFYIDRFRRGGSRAEVE